MVYIPAENAQSPAAPGSPIPGYPGPGGFLSALSVPIGLGSLRSSTAPDILPLPLRPTLLPLLPRPPLPEMPPLPPSDPVLPSPPLPLRPLMEPVGDGALLEAGEPSDDTGGIGEPSANHTIDTQLVY